MAISGGADSTALLLLLHHLLGDRCFAATVDHGLRAEAANEAAAVAQLCASRGIDHAILRGRLPERVGKTTNLSARARELRYSLLRQHAISVDATWVTTAHHADDQLETLIMRLNRGAGVGGLAAIRSIEHPDGDVLRVPVIRPLLGWRHSELVDLVAAAGVTPTNDPSNSDERFDRARLRKLLSTIDWLDPLMVAKSVSQLEQAEAAIAWSVARHQRESCQFGEGQAILKFTQPPAEIRRRLVELCLRHVDPGITPRGRDLTSLINRLDAREPATLGKVVCGHAMYRRDDINLIAWTFQAAPPRRAG